MPLVGVSVNLSATPTQTIDAGPTHALVKHEFRWQLSSWDDKHSIFILNQTHTIRGAVTVWRLNREKFFLAVWKEKY
jgi:hypothetical protein